MDKKGTESLWRDSVFPSIIPDLLLHNSILDQMGADAAAGLFAETVTENDEHNHENEREYLWEDICSKKDGVKDAVCQNRGSKHPKHVDLRCERVKTDKGVIISHKNTEKEVTWNGEQCT